MDYLEHFQLSDRPFKNTYDGRFFFRSQGASLIFSALKAEPGPTLIHLKGLPKTGKTSLLRRLPVELRDSGKAALILNPQLTLAEILRQALTDLGHSHKFDARTPEEELLGYFQNAVNDFVGEGLRFFLIVDSVDGLSPETLAELYALMGLEEAWTGRVRLLLCGRPDQPWPMVPDIMPEVRELDLPPLSVQETEEYVQFRLKAAGGGAVFSRGGLKALAEYAEGRPETINQLAERALIAAWSAGRREVGQAQVRAAKNSLDNPLALDQQALERMGQGGRAQAPKPPRPGRGGRTYRPLMFLIVLVVAGAFVFQHLTSPPEPLSEAELEPVLLMDEEESEPETASPAGENGQAPGAPALPTLPPQLLALPQGQLALVIDQDNASGRLWQGGVRGPGLKAELATPGFAHGGLYLFGRPRSENPLIFQYPPARDLPLEEARTLWPRVATLLPQNILPVIVAPGVEYRKARANEAEEAVGRRVKSWVQSQQYRFADTTAALYDASFQFFELGRAPRTIRREDFRSALNSEARTSGEVSLTTSQPLIMQDPGNPRVVWAVFNIKYDSKLRNDMGLRVLIFERGLLSGENWPIVAELWLPEKSLRDD